MLRAIACRWCGACFGVCFWVFMGSAMAPPKEAHDGAREVRWVPALNTPITFPETPGRPAESIHCTKIPLFASGSHLQNQFLGEEPSKDKKPPCFDIEKTHELLHAKEAELRSKSVFKKSRNNVLLSLSLFFEHRDGKRCAFTYPLREVFVSGSKPLATELPTVSLGQERFADGHKPLTDKKKCSDKKTDDRIHDCIHAGTKQGGHAYLGEGTAHCLARLKECSNSDVQTLGKRWKEERDKISQGYHEALSKLMTDEKEDKGKDDAAFFTLNGRIEEINAKHIEDMQQNTFSLTDAEQLMLFTMRCSGAKSSYLEKKYYQAKDDYLMVRARELCTKTNRDVMDLVEARISGSLSSASLSSADRPPDSSEGLAEKCHALFDCKTRGVILHLHSTRELCLCCAASLGEEVREGGLFQKFETWLREDEDDEDVFFRLFVSCGEMLSTTHGKKDKDKKGGGDKRGDKGGSKGAGQRGKAIKAGDKRKAEDESGAGAVGPGGQRSKASKNGDDDLSEHAGGQEIQVRDRGEPEAGPDSRRSDVDPRIAPGIPLGYNDPHPELCGPSFAFTPQWYIPPSRQVTPSGKGAKQ